MPLYDHFHPPLSVRRAWTSFHGAWCTYIAEDLNDHLPEGYFAEPNVQFAIEIDVATWEESGGAPCEMPPAEGAWLRSQPPVVVTDVVEVRVRQNEGGTVLAGAVELVSPANKDRPAARDEFVAKCSTYLRQGVGLVVVDVVTERRANLHRELMARVVPEAPAVPDADLYATAYRPVSRDMQSTLEVWHEALRVGGTLPTLPLWLRGGVCLRRDLDATYERTCRKLRFPSASNGA